MVSVLARLASRRLARAATRIGGRPSHTPGLASQSHWATGIGSDAPVPDSTLDRAADLRPRSDRCSDALRSRLACSPKHRPAYFSTERGCACSNSNWVPEPDKHVESREAPRCRDGCSTLPYWSTGRWACRPWRPPSGSCANLSPDGGDSIDRVVATIRFVEPNGHQRVVDSYDFRADVAVFAGNQTIADRAAAYAAYSTEIRPIVISANWTMNIMMNMKTGSVRTKLRLCTAPRSSRCNCRN